MSIHTRNPRELWESMKTLLAAQSDAGEYPRPSCSRKVLFPEQEVKDTVEVNLMLFLSVEH